MPVYNIWRFLFCFVLGVSLSVFVLLLGFLYYNDKAYNDGFKENLNSTLEHTCEKISLNVVAMCNLVYLNALKKADVYLDEFHSKLKAYGAVSVVDEEGLEYTYSENSFESNPILKFGDLELKNSEEIEHLLNNIKTDSKCDFAIYLRVNADADLVNIISTSSQLSDIYTPDNVIFRVGEDSKESKVINSLLLADKVDETIVLANTYVYVRYIPIMSTATNPRFIGAIACYMEEKNLNRIYNYLKNRKIKANGYYWIMEDLNNGDYRYKLSKNSVYDGNLLSENESSQQEKDYITNLTLTARFLRSSESRTDFIALSDSSDEVLVSYLYFEPWNWIIGTTVFKSEIQNFTSKVPSFGDTSIYLILSLLLLIVIFALVFSYYMSKPIGRFFKYIQRNFVKNKGDFSENFKSTIIDFNLFVDSLKEATLRANSFFVHMDKSPVEDISIRLRKIFSSTEVLADTQCEVSKDSNTLINSMYVLSEKLTKFSDNYKIDAKNTLTFTRQKAQSLRNLRKENELLKDIGGGFSSRFLRIRNIIEKLNTQLEDLKNYADKTKKLSDGMQLEIKNKDNAASSVFSSLVEDTNSFYGDTAVSIVTMKDFLNQMRESIDSSISEMRDFLNLIENGIIEIDDILEKISAITEQIAIQQSSFQEISRGASMQSEAILQVLKIISEVKRHTESTKVQVLEFNAILGNLEKSYKKLNK